MIQSMKDILKIMNLMDTENIKVQNIIIMDILCNVTTVGEDFFQEWLRVHLLPELVAFVRVSFDFRIVELAPVKGADELHVALARNKFRLDFRVERAEFPDEGGHAHDASSACTCVSLDVRRDFFPADIPVLENFSEILVHAVGNAFVLLDAHLREVSFARGGFGGENFCIRQRLLTGFGQFASGIGLEKCFVEILVFVGVVVVTAAVASVVADIERLVSGRCLGIFNICRFRVRQIIAGGKFRMLCQLGIANLRVHGCSKEKSCGENKNPFCKIQFFHVSNIIYWRWGASKLKWESV